ncbi:hypothetical protein Efla_004176 [Eimeria flavescens]
MLHSPASPAQGQTLEWASTHEFEAPNGNFSLTRLHKRLRARSGRSLLFLVGALATVAAAFALVLQCYSSSSKVSATELPVQRRLASSNEKDDIGWLSAGLRELCGMQFVAEAYREALETAWGPQDPTLPISTQPQTSSASTLQLGGEELRPGEEAEELTASGGLHVAVTSAATSDWSRSVTFESAKEGSFDSEGQSSPEGETPATEEVYRTVAEYDAAKGFQAESFPESVEDSDPEESPPRKKRILLFDHGEPSLWTIESVEAEKQPPCFHPVQKGAPARKVPQGEPSSLLAFGSAREPAAASEVDTGSSTSPSSGFVDEEGAFDHSDDFVDFYLREIGYDAHATHLADWLINSEKQLPSHLPSMLSDEQPASAKIYKPQPAAGGNLQLPVLSSFSQQEQQLQTQPGPSVYVKRPEGLFYSPAEYHFVERQAHNGQSPSVEPGLLHVASAPAASVPEDQSPLELHPFWRLPLSWPPFNPRVATPPSEYFTRKPQTPFHTMLNRIRIILAKERLELGDMVLLHLVTLDLIAHVGRFHCKPVISSEPAHMFKPLALRFLSGYYLFAACLVLGPVMNVQEWWTRYMGMALAYPLSWKPSERQRNKEVGRVADVKRLVMAMELLKEGERPDPELSVRVFRSIMCDTGIIHFFRRPEWDPWRRADESFLEWAPLYANSDSGREKEQLQYSACG